MPASMPQPRSVALVGPYGSGKSTLFDALLAAADTPTKRPARPRTMTTALRIGHCSFLGDPWSLLDAPGSVEFAYEAQCAVAAADLVVVVCDPAPERAATVAALLKTLDDQDVPHILFINRIDGFTGRIRDTLGALQAYSRRPLVLRQVPIRDGEAVTGYVDVASERAYRYRPGQASELMQMPASVGEREKEALSGLLEILADHDDALLEKILEDVTPTPAEIFAQLQKDQAAGRIVEVLFGAAERQEGVRRLWKALRHDVPAPDVTAARHGIGTEGAPLAQVFKSQYASQGGKLSLARVWRGPLRDGTSFGAVRIGGIFRTVGGEPAKVAQAASGDLVALARLEGVATAAVLGEADAGADLPFPTPPAPVHALAIATEDRKDDVRLSGALQRLIEEDPSLSIEHQPDTGETLLAGQGEMHLGAAIERLAAVFNVRIVSRRPRVPFRETIRRAVQQHARLKRQTGGHGQFADVKIEIEPLARGEGFVFRDKIVGGAIPRQYIPAVAEAAEAALKSGPFGHVVVDVAVTLVDGTFHSVDSSDMAFKQATRMAMTEGLAKADPVLLEPIDHVSVTVPSEYTPNAQRLLSGRRGRILGYNETPGWPGWDTVEALVPQAELNDFIIELRSQTMGLGTYVRQFDHLAEAHGPLAERVVREATAAH